MRDLKSALTGEGEDVAGGRESNGVNPAARGARVLPAESVKGQLLAPHGGGRPRWRRDA